VEFYHLFEVYHFNIELVPVICYKEPVCSKTLLIWMSRNLVSFSSVSTAGEAENPRRLVKFSESFDLVNIYIDQCHDVAVQPYLNIMRTVRGGSSRHIAKWSKLVAFVNLCAC
jgi:hypothetical protein